MNTKVEIYDPAVSQPIHLTDAAVTYLKKELQRQKALGMYFGVKKSGCSGFAYVVDYVTQPPSQNEMILNIENNLVIYIDPASLPYIQGVQIDCGRNGLNTTLKFSNPNEKGSCGCGESFTI
jgi:iron-sulfur cluster assembly accessory protein